MTITKNIPISIEIDDDNPNFCSNKSEEKKCKYLGEEYSSKYCRIYYYCGLYRKYTGDCDSYIKRTIECLETFNK